MNYQVGDTVVCIDSMSGPDDGVNNLVAGVRPLK